MKEPTPLVTFGQGETSGGKVSALPAGLVRTSTTKVIVLPPSGFLSIPVTGTRFYIVDQDSGIYIGIKTDRTVEELFTVGTGKAFAEEQYFKTLELRNTSDAETVTLTLFAGFGDYIDRRLTVVDGRFNSIVNVREAASETVAWPFNTIAALTEVVFNTVPAGMLRRRNFVISNMDLANSVIIRDKLGNGGTAVFPESSITLTTSGELRVYNLNGTPVTVYISENFYLL